MAVTVTDSIFSSVQIFIVAAADDAYDCDVVKSRKMLIIRKPVDKVRRVAPTKYPHVYVPESFMIKYDIVFK